MHPLQFFYDQHATVHSSQVAQSGLWSMYDSIVQGLTEEDLRFCPGPGMNSIAWLIWHMARTEDATVNLLVAGRQQVLSGNGWVEKLKLSAQDIGTGMNDEEVAEFSERVDVPALFAYRVAVGQRTLEVVRSLPEERLSEYIGPDDTQRLFDAGVLGPRAHRLAKFWEGQRKRFILIMPATGHNFMHLNEALAVRRRLDV